MRRAHLCVLGLWLWSGTAAANGGGYSFGVNFTGSVAPFQASGTDQVRILEEKLDILLRRTDAGVVVRYSMKNLTGKPAKVRFGFPVEATPNGEGYEEGFFDVDPESFTPEERRKLLVDAIQQLKGYAVTADGAEVTSRFEFEPFALGKVKPFPGSEALKKIAGWMVSEVTFPAAALLALEIRYSADHSGSSTYVSDDSSESQRSFAYRLSTGAVWSGTIGKGTVTVRADGIPMEEVEIAAPRERFKRDGDRLVWTFKDLEPTLEDDITIRAVPRYSEILGYSEEPRGEGVLGYLERGGVWGEEHQRFRAKASSTLPRSKAHDFGPQHLAESQAVAPWSEGAKGDGIGEWVELEPTRPAPLLALKITPGFASHRNAKLFQANGRPSRIEVLLNGEHRFTATLGDSPQGQLVPIVGYTKPVSRLRITILEVRKGAKYEDTCITRVALYDRLKAKPAANPAR